MTTAVKPKDDESDSGLSSSSSKSEQTKKTPKSNPTWHTEVSPPGAVPTEPSVASVPQRKRRASVDELMLKAKSGAAEAYRGLTMDPATALKKKRERLQEAWVEPESIVDEMSSFEKGCGYRFVLKESSYLRKSWSFIVALLLLYTGTVFPYKLAFIEFYIGASEEFEQSTERAWMPVELTVDILFWIDLFLIFLFSYKDENLQVEVCDLKAIGCRYLKGFFFVNFLACVPPSWFSVLFSGGGEDSSSSLNKSLRLSRLHRTSRLARLARLGRLAKLAPFLHESATWKYIQAFRGVRMMNLTVGLMWVVHLMACGWYLCAALHEEPNDTWVARRSINNDGDVLMGQDPSEQWVHALYFILTIFTTVGFGDMSAFTTAETLYVDWAMIVGTVVNSIIMSEVITTLTGVDRAQAELNKRYALIKEFSEHARLSGKVTTAFEKAVQRASHAGEMRVDPALMKSFFASDTLPRELMLDLTRDLFQGMLIRNELLVTVESHGIPLSSRLPLILAAVMHPKQFQFQDVVYQNADQPIHIYLVMRGTLAFVGTPHPKGGIAPYTVSEVQSALGLGRRPRAQTDEEDKDPEASGAHQHDLFPYKLFGVRSYLGEYEPFTDLPSRVAFARVESELGAEVLVLHKKDLLELKGEFPGAAQVWIKVARRKEWHRGQLLEQLTQKRNYKMFALHTIQTFYRNRFGKRMQKDRSVKPPSSMIIVPPSPVQTRTNSVSQESSGEIQRLRGKVEVMDQRMLEIQTTLDLIVEEMRANRP